MRPERLLRLYPRAWRERYGEEFLAAIGDRPLDARQRIDIVSGAIDAWLSADVRRAAEADRGGTGGRPMVLKSVLACERRTAAVTTRDALIGAAVMIGATVACVAAAQGARRSGWDEAAETVMGLSYPAAFALSMPFWLMRGQPWKAQAAIVGVTLAGLVVIGCITTALL